MDNNNRRIDNTREVFHKEFDNLDYFKQFLEKNDADPDQTRQVMEKMVKNYEALLLDAVKITRIGDTSQYKLLKAKEKIEELNEKLVESERNVRELNTILMFYIKATDK